MIVGIVGGGASGMAAALAAAENQKVQVILMERQTRVGRKLLSTGNGRCNLSNIHALERGYYGTEPEFCLPALRAFDPDATLKWFQSLGLFTVVEESGRVYPYSDQANSVVDMLRLALNKPNIQVKTGFDAQKIRKDGDGFSVSDGEETVRCNKLIVACGGLAGTKLGGSMAGYKLLSKLGHNSTRLRPALVQIKSDWTGLTALKGVRTNCHVKIFCDGRLFNQSRGELQFTQYGLSGPVIFEISRDVCYGPGKWSCELDFLPEISKDALKQELKQRQQRRMPVEELLTGILHNRLGRVLTKAAGVKGKQWTGELNDQELEAVCIGVKGFEIALSEPMGMDHAQVTAGGVLTEQFDPQTMESRLMPGLYACGEVMDIDGDCGGYNLQWAWSSGRCAGLHAGKGTV